MFAKRSTNAAALALWGWVAAVGGPRLFAQGGAAAPTPTAPSFFDTDWTKEVKDHLPSWLSVGGQYRGRVEGQAGRGFEPGNDDMYYLSRLRLNLDFHPDPHFHVFLQGQDARAPGYKIQPHPTTYTDAFDLRQAYVEVQRTEGKRSIGLKVGRQELSFGEERLVGVADWLNTARPFDVARGYVSTAALRLDVFAASPVRIRDAFNNPQPIGNNFYGAYASLKTLVPRATVEPYLFYKTIHRVRSERGAAGSAGIYTFGARWVGKLPASFDYGIEMMRQTGDIASDPLRAWAGHWLLGYTLAKVKTTPRLLIEHNYAAGDDSGSDGRRGTFDQLFPTNHNKYGTADLFGFRNMRNVRVGAELKLRPKLALTTGFLSHWLAQGSDSLYNASGAAIFRLPAGAKGSHVGNELDFVFLHSISKQYTLGLGYAHLWVGRYLKQTSGGSGLTYPYAFLAYNF
jgi:hypothetical protein